mgnify:CR=1 FL=1
MNSRYTVISALVLLAGLLLFAALHGCENEGPVGYAPLPEAPVVSWAVPADDTPPICGDGSTVSMGLDDAGRETQTCTWACAYFWTHDGNIGPRHYEKTWIRAPDGWATYEGNFWYSCSKREP